MATIVLVIHLILAVALVGVVLIQQSEGGALGIGGGGGMSGFMTGRSTANLLTRTTAVIAALFFATSITLVILSGAQHSGPRSVIDLPATGPVQQPATPPASSAPAPSKPAPAQSAPSQPAVPSVPLAK